MKKVARLICRTEDQRMLMKGRRSMNFWTSTLIRFTISPTVLSFLASEEILSDFL